jgi:hypothetical protein
VNFNIFFVFTYSSLQIQNSIFHLLIIIEWQERIPSSPWHPIFQTPPKRNVRLFFIVRISYLTQKLINNENYEHFSLITTFLSSSSYMSVRGLIFIAIDLLDLESSQDEEKNDGIQNQNLITHSTNCCDSTFIFYVSYSP